MIKDKTPQRFWILRAHGRHDVMGYPFEHKGIKLFLFREKPYGLGSGWRVGVAKIGYGIRASAHARTRVSARKKAIAELEMRGIGEAKKVIRNIAAAKKRACRVCGCTDDRACPGGCGWVEWDLCSSCAEKGKA